LDRARITYYRKTSGDLRYAAQIKGGWRIQTIDTENDVGRSSALIVNPRNNRSCVAYTDGTAHLIKFAAQNKVGTWGNQPAAKLKGGANFLSVGLSYYYGPMIGYYDTHSKGLRLAYYSDGQWQGKVV